MAGSEEKIEIKGCRVHNLKNVNLSIPRDKMVVITGLSGSGKSSLAFNTIYAEGQRRYVESLSAYARQFLGKIHKPEVDFIQGIPPAIAIEQKVNTRNPRSTVGTSTEVYDYFKLLYARIGKTISPLSDKEVKSHQVQDVVNDILKFKEGTTVLVKAPVGAVENPLEYVQDLQSAGFSRLEIDGTVLRIYDLLEHKKFNLENARLIIDRVKIKQDDDLYNRLAESISLAFDHGEGFVEIDHEGQLHSYSNRFELDGITFERPSVHMFSFNNPVGACKRCEGFGSVLGIDPDLVIPNKNLSIYEDAIAPWRGEKMAEWKNKLIYAAETFEFPVHRPIYELTVEQQELLWIGNKHFKGLNQFFDYLEEKKYKIQYRVMLSRYRGKTVCPDCEGTRLKKEAHYVKINGISLHELVRWPIDRLHDFMNTIALDAYQAKVAQRVLVEIQNRLRYLKHVGLGYLTLNRLSNTLSGGESQRINLATSLGSSLIGSAYILDEPSIGLHPRDTHLLINVLRDLQEMGNSVLIVEHDEDIIRTADEIVDIGPFAGRLGGEVVFQGSVSDLIESDTLTSQYLSGKSAVEVPQKRRAWQHAIQVLGAKENNLKNVDVKIPLNVLTVVTGVSGSGKSTLVKSILYPALNKMFFGQGDKLGDHDQIKGDIDKIKGVEFIDQNPIGKSSRSNPITYVKAYDEIRKLFSSQQAAEILGLKPAHFSFNTDGGRCDACQGEGILKVEMQFMADVELPCESCHGKRFKEEILEVTYRQKNIYDVLEMTIEEAYEFFSEGKSTLEKKIVQKIQPLIDVGLGYVKLGQSSATLSGGESQRVKLATYLGADARTEPTMFIFDEPTTGLHFHDIHKLMQSFEGLIKKGHTLVIIEHNLDVIKCADWIVDLGPEGGDKGGELIFQGLPEDLLKASRSYTGKFLKEKLS